MRSTRRMSLTAAVTTLLLAGGAASASAHHCFKDQWADAAYQHHLQGGTPWVPISDLGASIFIPPELQESCGWAADAAAADFMAARGLTQEPLIHAKATVGGGALQQGKAPGPFSYLGEEDFMILTESLMGYLAECTAG